MKLGGVHPSLAADICYGCGIVARARYRSKIFDTDTGTLNSIPVPERYFFYTDFKKSILTRLHYTLSQRNFGFIFSGC